jgi:putative membrane protein
MAFISDHDRARIGEAIAAAEKKTSGEIVAVLSGESASYLHVPFLWAALIALIVPWPLVYFTWWPVQWIYLIQLGVFLAVLVLTLPRRVRYALVPQSIKTERAHRRAVEQFLVQNLHTTAGPVRSPADLTGSDAGAKEVLFHELLERGVYIAPRGFIALSFAVTEDDADRFVVALSDAVTTLGRR